MATVTVKETGWARQRDLSPHPVPLVERIAVVLFVGVPILAACAAVPFVWGWGMGWTDVAILAVLYPLNAIGITVGYHRHFTHGGFKAKRWLRITLAILGGQAMHGSVIRWVADHRRHHKYADAEGDPHSPWEYGPGLVGLTKGLFHAHMGWLFTKDRTSRRRYAPDLLADPDIRFLSLNPVYALIVLSTFAVPFALGALLTWSWHGAVTALFWGGLMKVFFGDHITFSINSICHVFGKAEFRTRDRSRNVWWLAIPSFGESWHNLHHADPTCARHGVLKGQIDISARVIWAFERLGWVWDVRWPDEQRLAARRLP
ncbi:stearoyl-CoA desaturase (delta-9 desaturase) [Thermomonospora echinospora]|uniref:Stearoyl-CoA desaturase (Delta-9 desaturase) n=1 Tax=Thermomonospora echinospora TaxID=1992 RepID=A0A1H6DVJ4_9ACTN|nr:acyl-CoA desaturase [Thermomonospora echinospora]SEG89094.1 stearoyl-CoA desaturase (delta-9 desaturase) [Thermomonospora echinospora]